MADQAAETPKVVDIYRDAILRKYLQQHLQTEYNHNNFNFLMAADLVRKNLTSTEPSLAVAGFKALYTEYIESGSEQEINLPAPILSKCNILYQILIDPNITQAEKQQALEKEDMILLAPAAANSVSAVRNTQELIQTDSVPRFVKSDLFKKYVQDKYAAAAAIVRAQEVSEALETVALIREPVTKAIVIRGHSFITAAQLIAQNSAAAVDEITPEDFPLRQKLAQLSPEYAATIAGKTNSALLQEHLQMLDRHWLYSTKRNVPAQLTKKDLAALDKELVELVRENVYQGKKKFKQVKEEVDDAENHVCWKQRSVQICGRAQGIEGERTETPIAWLTTAQTAEWESILKPADQRRKWFTSLPAWEQQHLQQRVKAWQQQKETGVDNLGEFMGSVPTTIRRYPGAANAYKTSFEATGDAGTQTFSKVRTGYLVPFDIKDAREKARIAQQNIEQLLVVSIQDYIAAERTRLGIPAPGEITINMPFLVQTLQTAPIQLSPTDNAALFKAIDAVRKGLEDPTRYLEDLGAKIPAGVTITKIAVVAANRPVNAFRGLSSALGIISHVLRGILTLGAGFIPALDKYTAKIPLIGNLGRRYRENADTTEVLREHLQKKLKANPDDPGLKMADSAMKSYRSQTSFFSGWQAPFNCISSGWNNSILNPRNFALARIGFAVPYNSQAEQAALEQIVTGKIGVRIGSCVSGKDREDMVTAIVLAMTEFYAKHGEMPPQGNCISKKNQALRKEFVASIAKHFLSEHGQKLAGANAAGCDGLKNVEDVLCRDVCLEIRRQAKDRGLLEPIGLTDKKASLNKLHGGDVDKASIALRKNIDTAAVLSTAPEVIAVTPTQRVVVTTRGAESTNDDKAIAPVVQDVVELTVEQKAELMRRAAAPDASTVVGGKMLQTPEFTDSEDHDPTLPAIVSEGPGPRRPTLTAGG